MDIRSNEQVPGSAGAPPVVKSANEAREGVTGHNVRYVLAFGVAGVVLAFAVVYVVMFGWH
jgi:hypothetical protein